MFFELQRALVFSLGKLPNGGAYDCRAIAEAGRSPGHIIQQRQGRLIDGHGNGLHIVQL
jgi:hypothetical protein